VHQTDKWKQRKWDNDTYRQTHTDNIIQDYGRELKSRICLLKTHKINANREGEKVILLLDWEVKRVPSDSPLREEERRGESSREEEAVARFIRSQKSWRLLIWLTECCTHTRFSPKHSHINSLINNQNVCCATRVGGNVIIRIDSALVYGTVFWQNQTLKGARLNLSVNIDRLDEQPQGWAVYWGAPNRQMKTKEMRSRYVSDTHR